MKFRKSASESKNFASALPKIIKEIEEELFQYLYREQALAPSLKRAKHGLTSYMQEHLGP